MLPFWQEVVGTSADVMQASPKTVGTFSDVPKTSPKAVGTLSNATQASSPRPAPSSPVTSPSSPGLAPSPIMPQTSARKPDASLVVVHASPNVVGTLAPSELPHVRATSVAAHAPTQPEPPRTPSMARVVPNAVFESPASSTPAPKTSKTTADVNVEQLVDKIEKRLLRRIMAERDRRGGST